jgi:ribonuclease HII
VFAAAVVLDPARRINKLNDSKLIAPAERERIAERIRGKALAWAIASASVEEIDRINILQASLLAMRRAIEALGIEPDEVCVRCGFPAARSSRATSSSPRSRPLRSSPRSRATRK